TAFGDEPCKTVQQVVDGVRVGEVGGDRLRVAIALDDGASGDQEQGCAACVQRPRQRGAEPTRSAGDQAGGIVDVRHGFSGGQRAMPPKIHPPRTRKKPRPKAGPCLLARAPEGCRRTISSSSFVSLTGPWGRLPA